MWQRHHSESKPPVCRCACYIVCCACVEKSMAGSEACSLALRWHKMGRTRPKRWSGSSRWASRPRGDVLCPSEKTTEETCSSSRFPLQPDDKHFGATACHGRISSIARCAFLNVQPQGNQVPRNTVREDYGYVFARHGLLNVKQHGSSRQFSKSKSGNMRCSRSTLHVRCSANDSTRWFSNTFVETF
jgi:hypothetical protein